MEFTWHPPGLVESVESAETNRPIRLDQSWLRLLTPQLSSSGSNFTSGMNTMEDLLTRMRISDVVGDLRTRPSMYHDGGRCVYGMRPSSKTDTQLWNANDCQVATVGKYLQMIVGTLVADGLSRFGSHRVFENVDLPLRNWSLRVPRTFNSSRLLHDLPQSTADLASQWLSISVTGWVYYASETSDYLALAVVCIYMLLATTHVLWLLCPTHWISSDAWDNLTELLVLCKNSPPSVPSRLENASAGIYRLNTFATIVKVRVVDESENTEGPGLVEKVGNMDSKRVVLVEESPIKSQDELELALIGATTCATAVAPSAQSNLRKRTGVLEVVKIDARYFLSGTQNMQISQWKEPDRITDAILQHAAAVQHDTTTLTPLTPALRTSKALFRPLIPPGTTCTLGLGTTLPAARPSFSHPWKHLYNCLFLSSGLVGG